MDDQAPSSTGGPEPLAERIQGRPLPPFPTEAGSGDGSPGPSSDAALYQRFLQMESTIENDAAGQYQRLSNAGFRGSPGDFAQSRTEDGVPAEPVAAEPRGGGSSTSYIRSAGQNTSAIESPSWTGDRHQSSSYSSWRQSAASGHLSDGSSGPPSSRDRYRNLLLERTESFVVPRWQPDVEATLCPICHAQFSLFVRKHHCRKCGRVVCNSCSPHRITIPFQYIVQPPFECATPLPASCRTRPERELERMGSSIEVASLGGGERVRLCNPCVPDPNIAPPQTNSGQSQQAISSPARHGRSASGAIWTYGPYQGPQIQPNRQTGPISVREALANTPRRPREPIIFGNNDGPSYFSRPVERGSSYNHREDPRLGMDAMEPRSRSSTVGAPSRESHHMNNAFTPTGEAVTTAPQRYSSLIPRIGSDLSRPLPPSPQPRTQIPEEDECWVCHKELPSRTLPDFENQRSQHVESCIISAMRGSSPSPARPTQNTSTAITAPAAPSTSQPRVGSPSPAQVRRTGVFPYIATEKDCVDDAECTICLEEFEVGIEMGRLECFCRFHLKCIRHWFGSKPGQCPVHQHAGGY